MQLIFNQKGTIMTDQIFVDGKELSPDMIKLVRRCQASANAVSAYNKAFDVYWKSVPFLSRDEFWTLLAQYRSLIVLYRFQYNRTNGLDQAAKEFMRKAWRGERDYKIGKAVAFAKMYNEMCTIQRAFIPNEYGGGDSFTDAADNCPLGGPHIGNQGKYESITAYEAAVTMGVSEMEEEPHVLEKLVKFIVRGENYNCTSLRDAARHYLAAALRDVECPIDDPQYLRMDIDRETLKALLDKTSGPLTVQIKMDDEGIMLDAFDGDGEVIDTAWQMYADCGVKVTPVSNE